MTNLRPIRLIVAEDNALVRQTLVELLAGEDGVEVVGLAADGTEAIRLAERLRPDVVLMDFEMPWMNGAEATRWITTRLPGVRVVGLSAHDDTAAGPMLAAGAIAYVTKTAGLDELLGAVRLAAGQ